MTPYFETETLHALTSKGLKKFWKGFAVTNGEQYYTQSESWQLKANGTESKHILSTPNISTIKNEGRANEVQPREQAILEINAGMEKKKDSGYVTVGEVIESPRPSAMTAHPFDKRGHNIKYPCVSQPKLDGTRMLFDGSVGWSRNNKDYIAECVAHFQCELPDGIVLDGELMLDQNKFTFQETISAIKKFRPNISDQLQYYVYDLVDTNNPNSPFIDRYQLLSSIVSSLGNSQIILVPFHYIQNKDMIAGQHDLYVEQGYEGLMLRNTNGVYKLGNRSADLQKYKVFFDEEFTIIGAKDGEGKFEGCVTWLCETKDGVEFDATPRGTIEMKQEWYRNRDKYMGSPLTVRHFGYTDAGSLRFPVGIAIRDYE